MSNSVRGLYRHLIKELEKPLGRLSEESDQLKRIVAQKGLELDVLRDSATF